MWSGNTVIDKIDIDHDPVASEYGYVNKQWFEYGTPATNRYSNTTRTQPIQSKVNIIKLIIFLNILSPILFVTEWKPND